MTAATPLWLDAEPLVLASGSATRRLLLESAGIPVEVRAAAIDERAVEAPLVAGGAMPEAVAIHLARAKAVAVSAALPGRLVLGGDQTLALEGLALHKPASLDAAREQMAALSGKAHHLHSALALVRDGSVLAAVAASARLTMRDLSPAFIDRYLRAAGPDVLTSVGGYKLEGLGIHLFERVEGDHSTILGLPLTPLLAALRRLGAVAV